MTKNTTSKVAAYVRVSTLDQETGIRSQEKAVEQYLAGHGIADASWFRDRLSGKDTKRPGFEALQRAIFNGQVDTVVCWKLDRLSRSMRDGVNILCDWIDRGIRIVSVSQQLDFNGTVGRMIAGVLFALAEMERENLRENTKRGLAAARAKGIKLGRRPKLDPDVVQRMTDGGMSKADIATAVGVSRPTVYAALRRRRPA